MSPGLPRSGPLLCSYRSAGKKEMGVRYIKQEPEGFSTISTILVIPPHGHPSCCHPPTPPAPGNTQELITNVLSFLQGSLLMSLHSWLKTLLHPLPMAVLTLTVG